MFAKLLFRERGRERRPRGYCRVGHSVIPPAACFGSSTRSTSPILALIAFPLRGKFLRNVDDLQLLLLQ